MGGKKKGVKTGKHEKWEIIKRSTQKNLQGSSYKKEDRYLNPIVYNDIDQAINWKISRPLRVINTKEKTQFPLNGGTHQCCFHVIPKRGTVDELRRCRLLNKLVGVDMNFYRSVQPEGITATSIKFYFDQGNIPREFMFGRQFFCWHHLNLMFGTRPRFIDKDTDKTLGLFAVSNIPKGTLVAAFSNSKINGTPDLYYFRDLANYCTKSDSGTANAEIKTVQISQDGKKNTLNADYCVKYVPVDEDDAYKDHGDYFDKSIYSALELTENLTANLELPTQIFVVKKKENDFTLSYSKNNFKLKIFDGSDKKKDAKILDQSIRINRGKIYLQESVDEEAISEIIKKHGENLVFLYFCPKTIECLKINNEKCLSIENEPNQEILFFLGACSKKDNCITTLASIYDELVSQINGSDAGDARSVSDDDDGAGSGSDGDDGAGSGTDVDSQNFEANYFDGKFSAEYFDAMTPREYEYLRYIQSQGSQNTSAQISKILPTRSYMDGDERVRLNEPNRAIAYFKLFQLYRKNIDFKNELANRLDQYHKKVTEQVKKITYTPKEEYTEEDIKNLINNLNADPNKYFNEIVDQQYRNEKDIKKPNFLYQQTLALPMLRGVGTSGSSSGRSEVGSARSSGKCILRDNIINVFKNKKNSCWLDSALMFLFSADSDFTYKTANYAQLHKAINDTKKYIHGKSSNKNCEYAEMFGWNTEILELILGNGYRKNGFNDSAEFIIKILDDNYIETTQNIVQLDTKNNDNELSNIYTKEHIGSSLEINKKFLYKDDVKNDNFFKSITEDIAKNVIYKPNKREYNSNKITNFYITNEPKNLIFTNQGLAAMYSTKEEETKQILRDKNEYDDSNEKFVDYPEVTEINIYNNNSTDQSPPTQKTYTCTYNLQAILINLNETHYVLYFKYSNEWYFYNDIGPILEKQDYEKMKNYLKTEGHYHYLLRYIRDDEFKKIMDEQALALDERKKTITAAAAPSVIETGEIKKGKYFKNLTIGKSLAIFGNYYENGNDDTQTFEKLAENFSKKKDDVLFIYNNDNELIKKFLDQQHSNNLMQKIYCLPILVSADDLNTTVKKSIDNDIKTIEDFVKQNNIKTIIFSTDKSMKTLGTNSNEEVKKYIFNKILALAKEAPPAPKVKAKASSTASKKSKAPKGQKEKFNFNEIVDLQNHYLKVNTNQYLNNFIFKYLDVNSNFDREKEDDLNVLVNDLLYYSEKMPIYNTTAVYNSIYNRLYLYQKEQINIEEKKKITTKNKIRQEKKLELYKEDLDKIITFHGTLFTVMDKILPALKKMYTNNPTNIENLIRQYDLIIGYSSVEAAANPKYKTMYNAVKEQVKNYLEGNPITEVNDLLDTFKLIMNYIKKPTA